MQTTQLVGRRQEIELVESTLNGRVGRGLLLGGQPGVGKTRLAHEIAGRWAATDRPVEWMSAAAGISAIPFGAVVRLLPDVVPGGVETVAPREAELIRRAVGAARLQPERLVVVDDIHQLDDLSALLVHHLVLDGTVPVLMTLRTGEPVASALVTLWRDRHIERVDVLPLSPAESEELSARLLAGAVTAASADTLFASSAGNPLLLTELVRDAAESGRLVESDHGWVWDGNVGRSRRLREVIADRLRSAGDAERRAVTLLAMVQPLSASMLGRLCPDLDLVTAEQRGLLVVREGGQRLDVHLAHPLFGEVALDGAGTGADRLRLELADALAATGARRTPDLLAEAQLRLDTGDRSSTTLLAAAAFRALLLGATAVGLQLAGAAVAGGAPAAARITLGEALLLDRRYDEAHEVLDTLLEELTTDADRVRAAQDLQHLHQMRGDPERIDAVIERASRLVTDPVWDAVLRGHGIQYHMMMGRTKEATARAEELLAANDDPRVRLRLVSSVGSGRALAGRTDDALAFVADMLPDALRLQDELPLGPMWVVNAQALALIVSGRLRDAVGFIDTLRGLLGAPGTIGAEAAWLALFSGRINLARGRAVAAAEELALAADSLGDDDIGGFHRWARSLQAEAVALTGDVEHARALADQARASRARMLIYEGDAIHARAWVTALGGELGRAIEELLELASLQRLEGQHGLELYTLHDAVRLGALTEAGDRLAAVAGASDGHWAGAFASHVAALQSGVGAELEVAAEQLAAIGAHVHAAEAMVAAGRAYDAEQLRSRSATVARRCDELLADCGPVRTPALLETPARAELTRREREVVGLASAGLSNREIADRLFISLRTAEGHLYRAFAKLGVADRAELRAVLGATFA